MSKEKEKLITLKEAAKISGYAPDYIGQLIRKGKLPGRQIYCNVQWMTTREAVLEYLKRDKKEEAGNPQKGLVEFFRRLKVKFLEKLKPDQLVKISLWLVAALAALFALFLFYIFSVNIEKKIEKETIEKTRLFQIQVK